MSEIIETVLETIARTAFNAASKHQEVGDAAMEKAAGVIGRDGVGAVLWTVIIGLPVCIIVVSIYVLGPRIVEMWRQCSGC